MEPTPNGQIDSFLSERIAELDFPSAVYVAAQSGRVVFTNALGNAVVEPTELPATLNTIFDLASLTKPLVTGFLCALLVERGLLGLNDRVGQYLATFQRSDKAAITVKHILTHSSGLPAWRPLYLAETGLPSVLERIAEEPLISAPGEHVLYSDLGFITLGLLLEQIFGAPLMEIAATELFQPLSLKRTSFKPDAALRNEVAASETGNAYERGMCDQSTLDTAGYSWRTDVVWCEVHDGNAFFLGGAAGHAGLFSTAGETLAIAEQFIGTRSKLLKQETCELFQENLTPGLEEARSFGWQLAATHESTAGPDLPPTSFGHNGFTGTCCWVDAARERVYILLTNRTHHRTLPFANINGVRRRFNSLATSALNSLEKV
jgi:CubicO group peptidase (beta-lactamase class C family)